jgi:hypothetical protein
MFFIAVVWPYANRYRSPHPCVLVDVGPAVFHPWLLPFVENLNRPGILGPQTTCDLAGEKCQSTLIGIVDRIRLFDGPGDGIPSSSTAMIFVVTRRALPARISLRI